MNNVGRYFLFFLGLVLTAACALLASCGTCDGFSYESGNDTVLTAVDTPVDIDVMANDWKGGCWPKHIDGPLILTRVETGSNGTTSINPDGTVRYMPDPGFDL